MLFIAIGDIFMSGIILNNAKKCDGFPKIMGYLMIALLFASGILLLMRN